VVVGVLRGICNPLYAPAWRRRGGVALHEILLQRSSMSDAVGAQPLRDAASLLLFLAKKRVVSSCRDIASVSREISSMLYIPSRRRKR